MTYLAHAFEATAILTALCAVAGTVMALCCWACDRAAVEE